MAVPQKPDPSGLTTSVTHLLHRAGQIADEAVKKELDKLKVTPRQFTLLTSIDANPDLTQIELVKITGIDRSTMAEMTRRLVIRGLIEKSVLPEDKRATTLKLSPAGKRLLKQCRSAVLIGENLVLARVSATRRKSLMTVLTALTKDPAK